MTWEPDYEIEIRRRINLANKAKNDTEFQKALIDHWARTPKDFIKDVCITYDPRRKGIKFMPFTPFPKQEEFIEFICGCLLDGESGLVEKCRDMGFTWLAVAISVWLWRFQPNSSVGFGSRKQQLVDRAGDPDSIFEKIRMTFRAFPKWLRPVGFKQRIHAANMKFLNPENGATITGEIGDGIGRGGRKQIYFKDESAHYERPELIEASLGDNTEVQIDISSVNGAGNVFYRRRMAGEVWSPGCKIESGVTRVFIGDWHDDPRKNQEWYDRRRLKADREGLLHIFAQEVDRDYLSALNNIIIRPEWVEASVDAHLKLGIKEFGDATAGQDIADGGGDKNALAIGIGVILRACEHWAGEADDAPSISLPFLLEHKVRRVNYDSVGVGTGYKGGINALIRQGRWPSNIDVEPWSGGSEVLWPTKNVIPDDSESPKNEDHYLNLKAQAWFLLRARFIKTFRAIRHGEVYDHKDLISLDSTMPRIHELKMELSQAVHKPSANGKTMVDKKPDGTMSPNLADAVVIRYCLKPKRNSLFS